MKTKYFCIAALALMGFNIEAQEDTTSSTDDFDFSDFELAAEPAQVFCNNKVLGQSPTSLVGVFYNHQLGHDLPIELEDGSELGRASINAAQQISLVSNIPLISRNNILINMGVTYQEQRYTMDIANSHPLLEHLNDNVLRRTNLTFTLFKPLSEKNFILAQLGAEINGDYALDMDFSKTRLPLALLYGWKPSDRLMYAFGASRTYLGGALNYVPIIYYYHTFKNQKWGIEALLPARALLRYRFNSLSFMSLGFQVNGASFALNNFQDFTSNYTGTDAQDLINAQDIELRRSEIRAGLAYSRQLSGFFWISAEAGYRINYSYDVDQNGDFLRFFGSDDPYLINTGLENPLYFTIGLSYVSP